MAVYKRGQTWWYEFQFAGQRIQASAKTSRKTLAEAAEKQKRLELERAYAGLPTEKAERRVQSVAALSRAYRTSYALTHRAKSILWVADRMAHVERLLGAVLLPELTEKRIEQYMEKRLTEGAGHRTVNMELQCLSRAVGRTWHELWPKVKRLEEPTSIGRALLPEEEAAVLHAAATSQSRTIHAFIRIALLTGMRYSEIRGLRWSQIDFAERTITVGKSKSEAGTGRMIPMNADLLAACSMYAEWYQQKLGMARADWYVFPFCNRRKPVDPSRALTTIQKAWGAVLKRARVSCRFHDLRHTVATKMAEAGVPESTMLSLLGHMSRAMLERYSHIRMKAKREAVESLSLQESVIWVPAKVTTVAQVDDGAKPLFN
jgi:integrase